MLTSYVAGSDTFYPAIKLYDLQRSFQFDLSPKC